MMNYKKGNLIAEANNYDIICHGCNCFNTFGKGVAKEIKENFPEAYEVDSRTKRGDSLKLGTITYTEFTHPIIVNCYTQYNYMGLTRKVDKFNLIKNSYGSN